MYANINPHDSQPEKASQDTELYNVACLCIQKCDFSSYEVEVFTFIKGAHRTHLLREAFHEIAIMRGEEIRVTMIYCDMLMIFRANHLIPVREGKLLLSIISTVKQKR